MTPAGVHGRSPGRPCASRPALSVVSPSTSFSAGMRAISASESRCRGCGQLQQDPGDRRVGGELVEQGGGRRLVDVPGQVPVPVLHARLDAEPALVADVDLRRRVVADEHRRQPRGACPRPRSASRRPAPRPRAPVARPPCRRSSVRSREPSSVFFRQASVEWRSLKVKMWKPVEGVVRLADVRRQPLDDLGRVVAAGHEEAPEQVLLLLEEACGRADARGCRRPGGASGGGPRPGTPTWTGRSIPRRLSSRDQFRMTVGSKTIWVLMCVASSALSFRAWNSTSSDTAGCPSGWPPMPMSVKPWSSSCSATRRSCACLNSVGVSVGSPPTTNTSVMPGLPAAGDEVGQVGAVAHLLRREVRRDRVAVAGQLDGEVHRGVLALGRGGGDREPHVLRHVLEDLFLGLLERDHLVAEVLEGAPEGGAGRRVAGGQGAVHVGAFSRCGGPWVTLRPAGKSGCRTGRYRPRCWRPGRSSASGPS